MCPKIAVVGAGITGILTALACARKGAFVDIYDLNDIPNRQSNSWAYARLWRMVHDSSPYLEELAARSETFWKNMMHQTGEQLVRPVNVIRVNSEPVLLSLKQAYNLRQQDSYITELESTCLRSMFRIKDSSHKILTGKDGFLLNADSIYLHLVDEIKKRKSIKLIPNSNLFSEGLFFTHEKKTPMKKYSTVVFSTSTPMGSGSSSIRKKYQYHIDVKLTAGNEFRDAILDLGDNNKTWCVPSLDGKKLKLSASNFSFDTLPDETKKRICREYLLDMLKISYSEMRENISSYYEKYGGEYNGEKRWRVDKESGYVLMEACNTQHFKTAPATAIDISNYIFQ